VAKQYLLIGIAVGVFFAGLGIGSMISAPRESPDFMMQSPQYRQQMINQMMQDPQMMNMMMTSMMSNPQTKNQMMSFMANDPQGSMWMSDPQHITQMTELMRDNHDFAQMMIKEMVDDPAIRTQMLGHMTENQDAMQQMRMMVNGTIQMGHMGSDMMNP